jgi:nucleoside-diphosphate-sugar epimerase
MLILGRGYVGSEVAKNSPGSQSTNRLAFDLSQKKTWNPALLLAPQHQNVLWTFPAAAQPEEEDLAYELYETYFKNRKVILYGSTSAYQVRKPGELVTEETPLDLESLRTRTEENLRKKGVCILHLAGIFGPERDPLQWYLRGMIKAGRSYLNLIHLKDIAYCTLKLFEMDDDRLRGQRLNLANGFFKTHNDIVHQLKASGKLPGDFTLPDLEKLESKRVSNRKIREFLDLDFKKYPFIDFPN